MCITASVGVGGKNAQADGVIIQVLLNLNRPAALPPIAVDGAVGAPGTAAAIKEFQARVMGQAAPDGRVDPGGGTLKALQASLPPFDPATSLTAPVLKGIMPTAMDARISLYLPGCPGMRAAHRHAAAPGAFPRPVGARERGLHLCRGARLRQPL